jgi:transposase
MGQTRALVDESQVDQVMDCKPHSVCEFGAQVQLTDPPQRYQVSDVPPMRAQINEYRLYNGRCAGCGKAYAGTVSVSVPKGQLGPRALALVGLLGTCYHLTQRKICNLLVQLMGLGFSVGASSQAHGKVAGVLKATVAEAVASLGQSPALWIDETHFSREGVNNWVWAAVQPLLAMFAIYPSRARYVILGFTGEE